MKLKFVLISAILASIVVAQETGWEEFDEFTGFEAEFVNHDVMADFLRHVSEHKFNLTIFITERTQWPNGAPRQIQTVSYTSPATYENLKESAYDKKVAYKFLKKAQAANVPANARFVNVDASDAIATDSEHFVTNNEDYVPTNLAYTTFTNVYEGVKGYIPVDQVHYSRLNFVSNDTPGITEVYYAQLGATVEKSSEFSEEELKAAKEIVIKYSNLIVDQYDCTTLIVAALDEKLPEWNWIAYIGSGNFATYSTKYAVIKTFGETITVVGLPKTS